MFKEAQNTPGARDAIDFTRSDTFMAIMLNGQPVAAIMERQVRAAVLKHKAHGVMPKIVTMLVEGDAASAFYARAKKRMAVRLGIEFELFTFPRDVAECTLIQAIREFNEDVTIHGIMIELPLPHHVSTERIIETISPVKDVDGLTRFNRDANVSGAKGIYPATPLACVRLLKHYGYTLSGKHVVLVGCGKTVGMPLFHLLVRENSTVTVCHAGTPDVSAHIAEAEIAFVAVGYAGLITEEMVHANLVLVDAGINETSDHKIVGDVSRGVADCVAALSPTPGGVGPVTTMQLFTNLIDAMDLQHDGIYNHVELHTTR